MMRTKMTVRSVLMQCPHVALVYSVLMRRWYEVSSCGVGMQCSRIPADGKFSLVLIGEWVCACVCLCLAADSDDDEDADADSDGDDDDVKVSQSDERSRAGVSGAPLPSCCFACACVWLSNGCQSVNWWHPPLFARCEVVNVFSPFVAWHVWWYAPSVCSLGGYGRLRWAGGDFS